MQRPALLRPHARLRTYSVASELLSLANVPPQKPVVCGRVLVDT